MKISIEQIKKLREETEGGIADCRNALEEAGGDYKKAMEILKARGLEIAEKKLERPVGQGLVETYVHGEGKIGAMVEINCETDFVARTDAFKALAHELAMQVAAIDPKDVKELLAQPYIRDESKKVENLIKETIAKVGENIVVKRLMRFELGE